jgi:SPP1 gp7 family putative phage head morphogenesis protein
MLQLRSTRLTIEKYVYSKGTNVALYNAEHSKPYIAFQKKLNKALYDQITFVADYKTHLPLLMSLAKADDPLSNQVGALVAQVTLSNDIDLAAYLVWAGDQGGQAALDKLGINAVFGMKNQALIDYFKSHANLTISSVDEYTKKWIAQKIQEGKDALLTPFEIQQKLKDEGKGITDIRAERIVLTETQNAMTKIEIEARSRYGITSHIWRTSLDERVCPICGPLEGEERKVGTLFSSGTNGPAAHVSCRCYLEDVIPEDWVMPEKIWVGN